MDAASFVLRPFNKEERQEVRNTARSLCDKYQVSLMEQRLDAYDDLSS